MAMNAIHGFNARETFLGVPYVPLEDLAARKPGVAIVGAPFDWGTMFRPGARFGPREIRRQSNVSANPAEYYALTFKVKPLVDIDVVDSGDAPVIPGYMEDSLDAIRQTVQTVAESGALPIILGGDHTIALPDITAIANVRGKGSFGVVHFDSHADTAPDYHGRLYSHGTPMRRLIESGAVRPERFVQLGLRGYWPDEATFDWMARQGMRSIFMHDIMRMGLDAALDEAVRIASDGTNGLFISFDIDVVDPGDAPGTGTPESGGMLPREALHAIRRLALENDLVGMEVVEVLPAEDHADVTSLLASRVILEALGATVVRRSGRSFNMGRLHS